MARMLSQKTPGWMMKYSRKIYFTGKGAVPQGEVLRLRIGVGRTGGPALQVIGLTGGVAPQGQQVVGLKVVPEDLGSLFQHSLHPTPGAFGGGPAAHHQIEDAPEHGEGEDEQKPGDLVPRLHTAAHNGQGGHDADGHQAPVEDVGIFRERDHHHQQRGDLGQQGQPHKH